MSNYVTKDSGARYKEASGFQRDTQDNKPRFNLLLPKNVPYKEQFLVQFAELLGRGAQKYAERNWEQAESETALERAKESLLRHAIQACCDEDDEDHISAVAFNAMFIKTLRYKIKNGKTNPSKN